MARTLIWPARQWPPSFADEHQMCTTGVTAAIASDWLSWRRTADPLVAPPAHTLCNSAAGAAKSPGPGTRCSLPPLVGFLHAGATHMRRSRRARTNRGHSDARSGAALPRLTMALTGRLDLALTRRLTWFSCGGRSRLSPGGWRWPLSRRLTRPCPWLGDRLVDGLVDGPPPAIPLDDRSASLQR